MWKKIFHSLPAGEYDLRERMLRSVIQVCGVAVLVGMIEILVLTEDKKMLPIWTGLLAVIAVTLIGTLKYRKYDLASTVIGVVIIIGIFPVMFCNSGGIESGASIWMVLGIIYLFIMFKGIKLVAFLGLTIVTYGGVYAATYLNPDLLAETLDTRRAVYVDSFFSLITVGIIAGAVFVVHIKGFEEEHKLNGLQKEELEKSRDSQTAFFANMSHEIRTPINAIIGLDEMILRSHPNEEIREYAKDIQLASNMLLNQVNDILDLSQMQMSKMKIVLAEYGTAELFGSLAELIRPQAEKKQLDFYYELDENLPCVLYGDEKRLKQILLNVLDNAVKYTEKGSVTLSVQMEEFLNEEVSLKITVADTGIGIRKEDMDNIYDSFNRADEKKNMKIMGSGLGLAITKQLVDLMEGQITIDSIYTKGTVFTVNLKQKIINSQPVGAAAAVDKQTEERYHPSFEAPEARILIVDDSSMNTMVASKLLTYTKVQIDTASSGAECLEMTKNKYYHVILLDYMMPDMDGPDTLRNLRVQENGLCRETPVIALTGNTTSEARMQCMEDGYNGYVEKPIRGKALENEIMQLLPKEIIEYQSDESSEGEHVSQMRRMIKRKRKKVYITVDCASDIPTDLLEKYDIRLMYLYIKTPHGRFADTREIDSDSLYQYLSKDSTSACADSVTVEEMEKFFAETLTEAERVIHITLASRAGKSHGIAVEAAKGFDHVDVVDSGQISCGEGLLALFAAQMAMDGKNADEIIKLVEKMRDRIHTRLILPSADIFYQNGHMRAFGATACKILQFHPYIAMTQRNAVPVGLLWGNTEKAWKQGIRWQMRNKKKIKRDVVFITHVGCNVKQLEWLKKEILKCVPFERVIIQKASFTNACNSGMGTIGISFYTS